MRTRARTMSAAVPADPPPERRGRALSRRLDQGLGPDGRRLMYALMLPHKRELMRFNNQGVPRGRLAP